MTKILAALLVMMMATSVLACDGTDHGDEEKPDGRTTILK